MPSKYLLALFAVAVVASAVDARADGPDTSSTSLFKSRAEAISELALLELERKVAAERRALKSTDDGDVHSEETHVSAPAHPAPPPAILQEIIGSNGRMLAVFRLTNGHTRSFSIHETVPGFGEVRAITPTSVQDSSGHWHSVADSED